MELRPGYKQTEVGLIPDDWKVRRIKDLITIKSGFAFSSTYYADKGPILLTPGNFKLAGGLYFNDRNTKRYLGPYTNSMVFEYGDLLIVMTDLTPDCNLLGKPAFVKLDEKILHNQRIGKIIPSSNLLSMDFLYWFFSSDAHAARMKETATGSTVRHTSNGSIYGSLIPLPPTKAEQEAIANALSDTDALIESLEQLITKKRHIKQGAMQELLTGKKRLPGFSGEWMIDYIENLANISTGSKNTQDRVDDGEFPFFVRSQTIERINSYSFDGEAVLTAGDGVGTGKVFHYINGKFDAHQRVYRISDFSERIDGYFFYLYFSNHFYNRIMQMTAKSSVDSVRREMIAMMPIPLPPTKSEQTAIATILSDMDAEITNLETKLAKTRQLKQGMMRELLTGRIRLK